MLSEMFNRSAEVRQVIICEESFPGVKTANLVALPELPLSPIGTISFDGAHKIDVAVPIPSTKECIAIEMKLGETGLGKSTFENKFLKGCELSSHKATRVNGSMIAILERKLPTQFGPPPLTVSYNGAEHRLLTSWVLIIRQRVIDSWKRTGNPALSANCVLLSFEEVATAFGNRGSFNCLVSELIEEDYYEAWFGGG